MHGLMMDTPLLIAPLLEFAARNHGDAEIVTRTVEGPIHRYSYADALARTKRLARVLEGLGIERGDRVATMAWNGHRHFELYFAISGIGAVCHTLNPRLFHDQLEYIVNHAEDRLIFVDPPFVPILEGVRDKIPKVEGFVVMTDEDHMPDTDLPNVHCYETLMAAAEPEYDWPTFDENTASSLCYTSGTTGNPKGVLYSHRSTVLHSFTLCMVDVLGLSSYHTVLPVVPMFHANAWGLPYAAPMCGAKLVFPGPNLDGASIHGLVEEETVTLLAGVPTVWLSLLEHLRSSGSRIDPVEKLVIGGSAAPRSMIRAFQRDYGTTVVHSWGMTETSPVGTIGNLKRKHLELPEEERLDLQVKQGRAIYGVDLRIVDPEGRQLPRDGETMGELQVRGPWVAGGYFKGEGGDVLDAEGWFSTGDVATLDPDGYMQITDRHKDVIKSGGEWISSIDLENEAMSHPKVAEAAVIALPHPKWSERPLLVVVPRAGDPPSRDELLRHLEERVARWWLPDDVVFVDELPHTATGKVSKRTLRDRFRGHAPPPDAAPEA